MKAKPGQVVAGWSGRERDYGWAWGAAGAQADGNLIGEWLFQREMPGYGHSLARELERRGYDPKSIRFAAKQKDTLTNDK